MKVLIAPLNWGLGHASRCIPLVIRYLRNRDDVVLAGDGSSLLLLRKHFPNLRYYNLAPLDLHYSAGKRQVVTMLLALPKLIRWARKDHRLLDEIVCQEAFDIVISDNRFGCYTRQTKCVYMTHQLHILLPRPWRWLERVGERWHSRLARRFNETWVPDYEGEENLSGMLSHHTTRWESNDIRFVGPLSRFALTATEAERGAEKSEEYDTVVVLSGLEPQRTILEQQLLGEWSGRKEKVLLVRGLMTAPPTTVQRQNVTLVPYLGDEALAEALLGAKTIIARSGYSTIMDLAALGVLDKATLIPTPGQPEQEYLAEKIQHDKTKRQ